MVRDSGLLQQGITQAYIDAVYQAGGCPVLIPLGGPDAMYAELAQRLDGVALHRRRRRASGAMPRSRTPKYLT